MQKLNQEEAVANNTLPVDRTSTRITQTSSNPIRDSKFKVKHILIEQLNQSKDSTIEPLDSIQLPLQHNQFSKPLVQKTVLPQLHISPIRENRKSKSQFPNEIKISLGLGPQKGFRSKNTILSDALHIKNIEKRQSKFPKEVSFLQDLQLKNQPFSKGSMTSSANNKTNDGNSFRQQTMKESFSNQTRQKKHHQQAKTTKNQNGYNISRVFTLNNDEREETIVLFMRDIRIFKNSSIDSDNYQLEPFAEKKFRLMCSDDSQADGLHLKSLRLSKKKLRTYIAKIYGQRIADKLVQLFDFINPLDYIQFYRQVEEIFFKIQTSIGQKVRFIKQLGFQLYDMNGDNFVCEYDLFSMVKHSNDDLFIQAISQDIKDIQNKVQAKQQFASLMQNSFNEVTNLRNNGQINNLERFLLERQKINKINNNFLSVFNSPKNSLQMQTFGDSIQDEGDSFFRYTSVQNVKVKKSLHKQSEVSSQYSHVNSSNPQTNNKASILNEVGSKQRRQSIGHLLKKVNDMYQSADIGMINCEEFSKEVYFKYGVPMLIIHFLQSIIGFNYLAVLEAQTNQGQQTPSVVDSFDDDFVNLKNYVSEEFYEGNIIKIFNLLGEVDFKDMKQHITIQQIETKQYISFNSLKYNLAKVFGFNHDYFAEMLFKYFTNGSINQRVSIKKFATKLRAFWPKRPDDDEDDLDEYEKYRINFVRKQKEQEQRKIMNKVAFDFLDIDKDNQLSILDLIRIQSQFEDNTEICQEITRLLDIYKSKNIMPKYVRHQLIIDFDNFSEIIHESCLVKELKYIFVDRYFEEQKGYVNVFAPNPNIKVVRLDIQEKKKLLNYDGIFDQELINMQKK